MTTNELANKVCLELPEGWELSIAMENGCGMVVLHDDQGERHEDFCDPTEGIETQVLQALGYAKSEAAVWKN